MVNGFAPLLGRGGRGRGRYFNEVRSKSVSKFQNDKSPRNRVVKPSLVLRYLVFFHKSTISDNLVRVSLGEARSKNYAVVVVGGRR
jgi:hypothetical protein